MRVPYTRAAMVRLYPAEMRALEALDLPNGAHRFALDTSDHTLSFESFGDGKRYVWNKRDAWTLATGGDGR